MKQEQKRKRFLRLGEMSLAELAEKLKYQFDYLDAILDAIQKEIVIQTRQIRKNWPTK